MSASQQDCLLTEPGYIDDLHQRIRQVYRSQQADWVIAFSGSRDATVTLQLIWEALEGVDQADLTHRIHVVNVTTGVDSVVAHSWIARSLVAMETAAEDLGLPICAARLTRELADSFWVKLIGHGYGVPNPSQRWCADGLKRRPVERYIRRLTRQGQQVVLVLGSHRVTDARPSWVASLRHASEAGLSAYQGGAEAARYNPLRGWSADEVHHFLDNYPSPWDTSNLELLRLYEATAQEAAEAESTHAPMCGDCSVGCWVCTVLDDTCPSDELFEQRPDLIWLGPLFELRKELSQEDEFVDHRSTAPSSARGARPPRPARTYSIGEREYWLRRVLKTQREAQDRLPSQAEPMTLISDQELREIRRVWRVEVGVRDDRLERIYRDVLGQAFPEAPSTTMTSPVADGPDLLRQAFGGDEKTYRLSRSLLDVERDYRTMIRRAGVYEALSEVLGEEVALAEQASGGLDAGRPPDRAPTADDPDSDGPAALCETDKRL